MRSVLYLSLLLAALPAYAADERTPLPLTADEIAAVHSEMRGFLEGTQQIASAIAEHDMKKVAEVASPLGMAGNSQVPYATRMKFPMAFRQMGQATHMGFNTLATEAEEMGDPDRALKQLGETLQYCNACHSSYRLEKK